MLIVLSAIIYQGFVIVEIFLNSYNLLYPPYIEKPILAFQNTVANVLNFFTRVVATEV